MGNGPTAYVESNALLAAQDGDIDEVTRLLETMLPSERRALRRAASTLIDSIDDMEDRT